MTSVAQKIDKPYDDMVAHHNNKPIAIDLGDGQEARELQNGKRVPKYLLVIWSEPHSTL